MRCRAVAVLSLLLLPAGLVHAGTLPKEGSTEFSKRWDKGMRSRIESMLKGEVQVNKDDKDMAATVDFLAQLHTYRLTWDDNTRPNQINSLMLDLDRDLTMIAKNKPATQPLLELLVQRMIVHAQEVLDDDQVIARVNVARVLERLAQTGQEEVADALIAILNSPQNEGVKYWALRGLQDVLSGGNPGGAPVALKDANRETQCVLALLNVLNRKFEVNSATSTTRLDGMRVLRREAIRALALTRRPAVVDGKKEVYPSTLALLRVIAKDGFNPEPRWDEQVEAAIGVARMQSKLYPDYQPDYAAQQVGAAVLEFVSHYQTEHRDSEGRNIDKGWKYYASRLLDALDAMQKDATAALKDDKAREYVRETLQRCKSQLQLVNTGGETKPEELDNWLSNNAPVSETVYKGMADAKVHTAAPMEK